MKINNTFKLIIAIVVSELAGIIGSVFTTPSIAGWYAGIVKPALNPPAWVFGPVWTTLFALMGIAAFLVWKKGLDRRDVKIALGIFLGQLVLNTLWSIIFFGLHSPGGALIEIVFLWLAILATIVAFYKTSKPAAWLLVPYILWVSFSGYLNYSIWTLNRDIPAQIQVNQQKVVIATDALKAVVNAANEVSGITSGAVFTFELADADGHFSNFGLVRYANEVKADPVVPEHAVTFREIGEGSSGNAEVDSVSNQVISMHRRVADFGGELSAGEIEQRARQFLERVYPDFKTVESTLTPAVNMKGVRLNNGNYFYRWDDLNYKNTLPKGVHADIDPFVQVGMTANGFIFSYDNTVELYRNTDLSGLR
jgi:tryptophan-rich sensory protein